MNKKAILSWLSLAMLVATSACGPARAAAAAAIQTGVATVTGTPGTVPPVTVTGTMRATETATATTTATDTKTATATATETATATATETAIVTKTPIVFPTPGVPSIPTENKPSLTFSPINPLLQTIIGYVFPANFQDWTAPIKVAAFVDITIDRSQRLTPVGMLEIGPNPDTKLQQHGSGIYLVVLDLISKEKVVKGKLFPITGTNTFDLTFQRIPRRLNPARTDSPYDAFRGLGTPPDSSATISADSVCFTVKMDDTPTYNSYCSKPTGPDEPASPLSVMDNFPFQYANLQALISEAAQRFDLQGLIQEDRIIAEKEAPKSIQDCASEPTQQTCGADIVVAPVTEKYFKRQFKQDFGPDDGGDGDDESSLLGSPFMLTSLLAPVLQQSCPFHREAAIVKVLQPIDTSSGIVRAGDYHLDYFYDANCVFYAATITGFTTDNTPVTNQPVPAVPEGLVNANNSGPEPPPAQISVCIVWGYCVFFECGYY